MKLHSYKNLPNLTVEQQCEQIFIENYIKDIQNNNIFVHRAQGERVVFKPDDFKHSFSYRDKDAGTEKFSFQRARRVLWMKKIVIGDVACVRKDIGKEVYFYYNSKRNYLVFLKKMSRGDLRFVTHYVAKSKKKQYWIGKNITC